MNDAETMADQSFAVSSSSLIDNGASAPISSIPPSTGDSAAPSASAVIGSGNNKGDQEQLSDEVRGVTQDRERVQGEIIVGEDIAGARRNAKDAVTSREVILEHATTVESDGATSQDTDITMEGESLKENQVENIKSVTDSPSLSPSPVSIVVASTTNVIILEPIPISATSIEASPLLSNPPSVTSTVSLSTGRPITPSISPTPTKKFASSLSVNKKFLEKAGDKGKVEVKAAQLG
jgi:hypothetical protein